ncbi:MAG: hypothetical protein KF900_08940 [Bacteroidetes bacterium]|nr:hypothetical protein [Bacteroidota bacterium]
MKDYRTPSKDRLEQSSDIQLPTDFTVLKDEYQNVWQHYSITYEIQLNNNSVEKLIKSIKTSKFYNKNSFHNGIWDDVYFIKVNSGKALWAKTPKGYDFSRGDGLTMYQIELDTLIGVLKYHECSD